MKAQVYHSETLIRCTSRTNHVAWCRRLQKFCDAPIEYHSCNNYQPKLNQPTHKGGY